MPAVAFAYDGCSLVDFLDLFIFAPRPDRLDRRRMMTQYTATVEKRFKSPGPQPNALQATDDGLWILDQVTVKAQKVDWETGAVLAELDTDTEHSSGITLGAGAMWISSTFGLDIVKLDPATGETLERYSDPGRGHVAAVEGRPDARESSCHGLEWRAGRLYCASPPTQTIHVMEVATWTEVERYPSCGLRVHGVGWHDERHLWVADTSSGTVMLMDTRRHGRVRQVFRVAEPNEVHGMTVRPGATPEEGEIWYCDALTCDVGILHRNYESRPQD